jgi:hypothetical protein
MYLKVYIWVGCLRERGREKRRERDRERNNRAKINKTYTMRLSGKDLQ